MHKMHDMSPKNLLAFKKFQNAMPTSEIADKRIMYGSSGTSEMGMFFARMVVVARSVINDKSYLFVLVFAIYTYQYI